MISTRDWYWRGWRIRYIFQASAIGQPLTKPPLLLIHGFGAAAGHWRHNVGPLSEERSVYALDLLGFGNSAKVFTEYRIDLWRELIYDFWRTFIGRPIILIGNSLGSLVSLAVAAQYPEVVKGLIMLNVPDVGNRSKLIPSMLFPFLRTIENLVANSLLLRPLFYVLRRPSTIRRILNLAYFKKTSVDEELIQIISGPAYSAEAERAFLALVRYLGKDSFSASLAELLANVQIPILLLWGKEDRIVPFRLASKIIQTAPSIQFIALDRTGHCPHDEHPTVLNRLFLSWLSEQAI
jgi:pimeloyl-ACP methyl ester carboxylesterase